MKKAIRFVIILAAMAVSWLYLRHQTKLSYNYPMLSEAEGYTEEEKVLDAIALSYLVYGCEKGQELSGDVTELMERTPMGIVLENFGLVREKAEDPSSTAFDTSAYIKERVGALRFLTDKKEPKSGFYGAAFCDDEKKCIWVSFSGSVDLNDAIACAAFVLKPGLSAQEKMAHELALEVCESREIMEEGYSLILTGHSLGGALASEVSLLCHAESVTINGADGLAATKLSMIRGGKSTENRISNYMTDPANGKLSFMDLVQRMMYFGNLEAVDNHIYTENGLTTDTHCAFSFVRYEDGSFSLPK